MISLKVIVSKRRLNKGVDNRYEGRQIGCEKMDGGRGQTLWLYPEL